jgi:hypothetical protein
MSELLFNVCLAAAEGIVARYRNSLPEGAEYFNGSGGGGDSDSNMVRRGSTFNVRSSSLPTFLSDIITQQVQSAAIPSDMAESSDNLLSGLLSRDNTSLFGSEYLTKALGDLDPTSFDGRQTLQNIANRDPYSTDFETQTANKYQDLVDTTLSRLQSGPDVVRGGTNRLAMTQGQAVDEMARNRAQEIRNAQSQDAQLASNAAQILNSIESGRRATLLSGQNQMMQQYLAGVGQSLQANDTVNQRGASASNLYQLAARSLGSDLSATTEDLAGRGSQSTSSWNAGLNCCFIFIEGLEGRFPWFVRRARDIFYEECPARRDGYVKMATWLVPWMRKSTKVRWLVKKLMIEPCVKYGAWLFDDDSAKKHHRFYGPVVKLWFSVWKHYGKV